MTDEELKNWEDINYEDGLFEHFEKTFARWDWCELSKEGGRVFNVMFDDATKSAIEEGSPLDCLFSAIAAQAAHGAFSAVAASLGIDVDLLELAVAGHYENQDSLPPPFASIEELLEEGKRQREWGEGE